MSRTQSTSPWIVTLAIYIIGVADGQEARGSTIEDLKLRREGGKGKRPEYILTDVLQVWFQPIPLIDDRKSPDLTGLPVT
jgi:hypothetical protein